MQLVKELLTLALFLIVIAALWDPADFGNKFYEFRQAAHLIDCAN